jgi:hypothetical protein
LDLAFCAIWYICHLRVSIWIWYLSHLRADYLNLILLSSVKSVICTKNMSFESVILNLNMNLVFESCVKYVARKLWLFFGFGIWFWMIYWICHLLRNSGCHFEFGILIICLICYF